MTTLRIRPEILNLEPYQGDDVIIPFQLCDIVTRQPIDITDYTITGQVRRTRLSADIAASFVTSKIQPLIGIGELRLSSAVMAALDCGERSSSKRSQYVWDAHAISPTGRRRTFRTGTFNVLARVTRTP